MPPANKARAPALCKIGSSNLVQSNLQGTNQILGVLDAAADADEAIRDAHLATLTASISTPRPAFKRSSFSMLACVITAQAVMMLSVAPRFSQRLQGLWQTSERAIERSA